MATTIGGEDWVVATAQHILKSLRTSKDITDDMLLVLSSFDNRLSNISDLMNDPPSSSGENRSAAAHTDADPDVVRFESAEKIIIRHGTGHKQRNNRFPWGDTSSSGADVAFEYLAAIDEVLLLTEDNRFQRNEAVMERAETAVQVAMAKLEREFCNLMAGSAVALDADRLYGGGD